MPVHALAALLARRVSSVVRRAPRAPSGGRVPGLLPALALALGCTSAPDASDTASGPTGPAELAPPAVGELLIEELYYAGAVPQGGTDHYYSDQFLELANAADGPLDLSGVLIGEVYGSAGAINSGMTPDSYRESRPRQVVMASVWRIPDGIVLERGETLVVAHDGVNHRPFSTIDLSGAGLETWVDSGNDDDSPTVANLEEVHFEAGYDWLLTVFGPSVVLLSADTELDTARGGQLRTAHVDQVLDGIDTLMDGGSGDFKRLPDAVDAGFAWVSGTYTGESVRRKRSGDGWQDTDDSGADFEVGAPEPGLAPDPDDVFGDPWIELGTGTAAFEPLADGGVLELVAGPQGGWHLDVALRFGGFGPDGVSLVYDAVDPSAEPVSFTTQTTLTEAAVLPFDDGWERVGDRVVLDIGSAEEVVGAEVVVRVTAALGGSTWSDERTVTVVDDVR